MMITNKHKAYLIISITFLLGTLFGASGQYLFFSPSGPQPIRTPREVTQELAKLLTLDESQQLRVEQIFESSQREFQDAKTQMKSQWAATRESMRKRIRETLTPEQQTKYEAWTRELDARREQEVKK
ncbi:MAG: hypothetical protein ACKVX9_10470 [Blastocatellia bacterium]